MKVLKITERRGNELYINTSQIWYIEQEEPNTRGVTQGTVIQTEFGRLYTDEILSSVIARAEKEK